MSRLWALSLVTTVLGLSSGCAMCCAPFDYDYIVSGGRWTRYNPSCGRVGSAFDEAGGPSDVAMVSATGEPTPAQPATSQPTPAQPTPSQPTPSQPRSAMPSYRTQLSQPCPLYRSAQPSSGGSTQTLSIRQHRRQDQARYPAYHQRHSRWLA